MSEERIPTTDPKSPCTCAVAGYCSRFDMQMTGRMHQLCQSNPDYRWLWAGQQGPKPSSLLQFDCIYRGRYLGREGCIPCENAGKSELVDVFACECPKVAQERCALTKEVRQGRTCADCTYRRSEAVQKAYEDLTLCVTHWERPEALKRLLDSIQRFYPDLPVLVEDTGGNLSAGRNRLVAKCQTTYLAVLEEDFEFTRETRLEKWLEILVENPDLGGASGPVFEPKDAEERKSGKLTDKKFWDCDLRWVDDQIYLAPPRHAYERTATGVRFHRCDLVLNFGIFRRQLFADVPWDENLPVREHTSTFTDFWQDGRWTFAYTPEVSCLHWRDRPSQKYRQGRNRSPQFDGYLREKHGAMFNHGPAPKTNELRAQNVVVLGHGRSNTSVVTRMLAKQYRLHTGKIHTDEYSENAEVLWANIAALKDGSRLDPARARRALRSLPEPWVIKDPRFSLLLDQWLPFLEAYEPRLVYVTKDPAAVKASCERAGWAKAFDPKKFANCEEFYRRWPWAKERFDAADLNEAVKLWDCERFEESVRRGQALRGVATT